MDCLTMIFFSPQLAHCIKLLLEYTKTPYNEKHYAAAEGKKLNRGLELQKGLSNFLGGGCWADHNIF